MARSQFDISGVQARRIALGAQGFVEARPVGRIDRRHGRRLFSRVGVVQIDSVNVLCRSEELSLFARLGSHPRDLIRQLTANGEIFEYWAHMASHVPVRFQPLLRWRMAAADRGEGTWGRVAQIRHERPDLVQSVLDQIERLGPLSVGMVDGGGPRGEGMWAWSEGKVALEYLFWSGRLTATRGRQFERRYELVERALPAAVLAAPTPAEADAKRELLVHAARFQGLGTAADLADYFRINVPEARRLVDDLAHEGGLIPVRVEGWRDLGYLHPEARRPRRVRARALLSPFDSLIWTRDRTERLWDFRYRVEIYVPATQRVHGYYVLPFLLGSDLVARVDLKADRAEGLLRVQAAHGEAGHDRSGVASELAAELAELADFLGLTGIAVRRRGDLAATLAREVKKVG